MSFQLGSRYAAIMIAGSLAASSAGSASAAVLCVDANVIGGAGDGSSWDDAFGGETGVQSALTAATSGDQIWIADGMYVPTSGTSRTASFVMKSGVALYGGFDGGEVALEDRDPAVHIATLSGDLNGNDGGGTPGNDNSYHVVRAEGGAIAASSVLSGVHVSGGNANGGGDPNDRGGALFIQNGARPRVVDCVFENNRCTFGGGAGYVRNAGPTFVGCTFTGGNGGAFGGAFDIFSSGGTQSVRFESCRVFGNSAARAGGIEAFGNVNVTLINTVIGGNTTTGQGGGMFVGSGAGAFLESSTIAENASTGDTGGVHLSGGSLTADNCIFADNTDPSGAIPASQVNLSSATLRSCIVTGGWTGGGSNNIDGDPELIDVTNGSAVFAIGSIAADAGNNTLLPAGTLTDISGNERFHDDACAGDSGTPGGAGGASIVDIGAFERTSLFVDCNTNGVADECEVADGSVIDCDRNGVPDSCDVAEGAEDCNGNGTPDTCEVAHLIEYDTGVLGPIGNGSSKSFTVPASSAPAGDVQFSFEASGDFGAVWKFVRLEVNGTSLGNLFAGSGECQDPAALDGRVLTAAEWTAIVPDGTPAMIELVPSAAVDVAACSGNSWIRGMVTYVAGGTNDVDQDGVPDDCDGALCPSDLDGNGDVGFGDLLMVLGTWGACEKGEPCLADLDESNDVGFADLLLILGAWGAC